MFFFDETKLRIIKNGAILPFSFDNKGGVLDCQGNFVEESKGNGWLKLGGFYPIDSEIRHSTEKVVYLGFCVKHWGHFIVECLGRVWTLLFPKYAEYNRFGYKLLCLFATNNAPPKDKPLSPAQGGTKILSNSLEYANFEFNCALRETPPAKHKFFDLYLLFFNCFINTK